jgi:cytochrome c553
MNRSHILGKAALAILFVGVLLVSYPAARPAPKDQAQLGAQVVAQGTTNGVVACARCHGFDGAADGSGAFPKLAGQSLQYLAQELRAYASGDRQNALMQSIAKGLSAGEIDAVAQYYAGIPTISLPSRPQSAQLIARGERLAKVGDIAVRIQACESCHGPNGQGEPPTVPYLAGQYSHYISLQIQMFRKGYRKSDQMKDPSLNLSDQDVAAVAAYFEQLPRSTPK